MACHCMRCSEQAGCLGHLQELLGTCVWGNYCGGKCDGVKEGKEPLSTSEDGGLDQVHSVEKLPKSSCRAC